MVANSDSWPLSHQPGSDARSCDRFPVAVVGTVWLGCTHGSLRARKDGGWNSHYRLMDRQNWDSEREGICSPCWNAEANETPVVQASDLHRSHLNRFLPHWLARSKVPREGCG